VVKIASGFVFLVASIAYFFYGYRYSFYTADGRFGAGFFPRVVGASLVVLTLVNLVQDIRGRTSGEPNEYWRDIGIVTALLLAFVYVTGVVGAVLGMFMFILAVLSFLNRGRWITNLSVSVGIPLFIHLLFRVWLNAPLPTGRIEVPFLS
jgi:putative tricarboxylic transport membrane protein